jgi:DNA-binding CsgD family transcriptional regulator
MDKLTPTELRVLELVSLGNTNAEVGLVLKISEDTAKSHLRHTYSKLGVGDRALAVRVALERGILRPRPGTALEEALPVSGVGRGVADRHIAACFAAESCPCRVGSTWSWPAEVGGVEAG